MLSLCLTCLYLLQRSPWSRWAGFLFGFHYIPDSGNLATEACNKFAKLTISNENRNKLGPISVARSPIYFFIKHKYLDENKMLTGCLQKKTPHFLNLNRIWSGNVVSFSNGCIPNTFYGLFNWSHFLRMKNEFWSMATKIGGSASNSANLSTIGYMWK